MHLKYESGREVDWFRCGFSPRKDALVLYGVRGEGAAAEKLLSKLGTFQSEKGCLYVKTIADIDLTVLGKLVQLAAGGKEKSLVKAVKTTTAKKKSVTKKSVTKKR